MRLPGSSIVLLSLAALAVGCGGDDGEEGGAGAELEAAALRANLESEGYDVQEAARDQLPATVGSFALAPDTGFETGLLVSGNGLTPPSEDISDTVTVLVYGSADEAEAQLESLGGEEPARTGEGNRIYLYGGGVAETAPELEEVIEASEG